MLKNFLVAKKKMTFQSLSSVAKSFDNYLGIKIPQDQKFDDIKFAFECRHVIVHNVSKADEKFIRKCNDIRNRNIKRNIFLDEDINFTSSELEFVKISMLLFVQELTESLY